MLLSDINGDLIAVILLAIGGLTPLGALVVGTLRKGRRYLRRHWYFVAGYYALETALMMGMFCWSRIVPWPHEQPVPLMCTFGVVAILGGPILGLILIARISAASRYPDGACQKCGYDLTGNVSGRCPECGAAVPPNVP
jgi:hypothetical protein